MPVKHAQTILIEFSPTDQKKHDRAVRCCAARKSATPVPPLSFILPALWFSSHRYALYGYVT